MGASLAARKPATLLRRSGSQGKVTQVSFKFDICHHALGLVESPTQFSLSSLIASSIPTIILTII